MEVCLQILQRLIGQGTIQEDWLLANLSFEVIPPIILLWVSLLIYPYIEVNAKDSLIGRLTHVGLKAILIQGDTLASGSRFIILKRNLCKQVLTLGQVASDATRSDDKHHRHK